MAKRSAKKNKKKKQDDKKRGKTSRQVDKYDLYIRSVQSPEHEVDFFDERFKAEFGRKPLVLREDFCGTFGVCCDWVKREGHEGQLRQAIGVDLDPEPLEWGKKHLMSQLEPSQQRRIALVEDDVRSLGELKADVLAAQNFSFWIFKQREQLLEYLKVAYANLADQGVMVLDMFGGNESMEDGRTDTRKIEEPPIVEGSPKKFSYHWEQASFDPITHDASFYIHFEFKDGSKLKKAFEYHWRFWMIPEVRDLLAEAGFDRTEIYWDTADEDADESVYELKEHGPNDLAWICYILAIKDVL